MPMRLSHLFQREEIVERGGAASHLKCEERQHRERGECEQESFTINNFSERLKVSNVFFLQDERTEREEDEYGERD